ncbi:uncharacterized protein [Tenebrio molitor]|uniref:uncharacterized protein isoform X4 n=1 Tax=Tenebrio molitor TaxID=7067 RepID=UPI00362486E9
MEKLKLYLLLLIEAVSSHYDIVTLRKENEVYCITQDVTLPRFISPPVIENSTKSLSLLIGQDWTCDNWILIDGSNSPSGSVIDKRWENFEVMKTNFKTFTFAQSVSISLHSPVEVKIFVNDYEDVNETHLKDFKKGWNHISIFLRNNSVLYLLNNEVIKSADQFNPHEIAVKTENDTFWKIHNYHFMMSENVTDGKPTRLTIPHTENSCFLLYVSLCEKCVLAIPELSRIYNSINDSNNLNSWQVYQLELDTGIENLSFYKRTTDNTTLGYWGIDLHECPANNIASRLLEKDCKWACNLCNNITSEDSTTRRGSISTETLLTITLCGILGTLKVVTAILVMKHKNARNQNKNEDLRGLIDI